MILNPTQAMPTINHIFIDETIYRYIKNNKITDESDIELKISRIVFDTVNNAKLFAGAAHRISKQQRDISKTIVYLPCVVYLHRITKSIIDSVCEELRCSLSVAVEGCCAAYIERYSNGNK